MLLDRVVQPSTISLFSSTSSHPTLLARCTAAADSTADSFVCLLNDATDSHEEILASKSPSSATNPSSRAESLARLRRGLPDHAKDLDGQVLHLQAPDCRTTSIRWGSLSPETARQHGLGVELPAVHFQLKHLEQTMYLEVAVLDERGEVTVVRCSTFQTGGQVEDAALFGELASLWTTRQELSDAYKVDPPLEDKTVDGLRPRGRWSHDFRPLPYGGGYLTVEQVTKAVLKTGWRGILSVEVFDSGPEGKGKDGVRLDEFAREAASSVQRLLDACADDAT